MAYSVLNVLILIALGLMLVVTLGVVYLTTAEWRDRRREERDKKAMSKK